MTVLRTPKGNLAEGEEDAERGTWTLSGGLGLRFKLGALLEAGWERA